jgi:hypothetical protein
VGRSIRALVAAVLVAAAAAVPPAQALGPRKPAPRASSTWTRPRLVAKVTGLSFPKPSRFGLPLVTVTFRIGEAGKPPGTGVTFGSYFLVHLASRTGAASGPWMLRAYGTRGRYRATMPIPPGGIGGIEVGGWINVRKGPSAADGTFWIPVVIPVQGY